jgi:hypothetical protein
LIISILRPPKNYQLSAAINPAPVVAAGSIKNAVAHIVLYKPD